LYRSVPVSANNGDGSVHKAIQILVDFLLEQAYGQQKDAVLVAESNKMFSLLEVHNLSLTGVKEVSKLFVCGMD